jgi:hypothetical protein
MSLRPARAEGRRPAALHVVALTTLLTFGCTTVRAPVSGITPTIPVHGSTAEPQVELWLESAADPTPTESVRAAAEAREALRLALQDRKLGDDDVLVVRAQAVSRTPSHRADQHAAIAGLVVGFVALVALAVVASRGGGAPVRVAGGHAGRGAGGGGRGSLPAIAPRARRPGLAPPIRPGGVNVNVDVAVVTDPTSETPPMVEPVLAEAPSATPDVLSPPPGAAAARISAVALPTPPPLTPDGRSFFDGDWVRLELFVVDARTGAVRWTKVVTEDVDVRDARKVRRVLDDALATEAGWEMPSAVAR